MILDIDFDYFVKEKGFHDFGYQERPMFQDLLWKIRFIQGMSHPIRPTDTTQEFTLDEEAMKEVMDFIKDCKIDTWAVSDSHLNAIYYIQTLETEPKGIIHIDRHSDFDKIHYEEIHCGNWLRFIKEQYIPGIKTTWIPQSMTDLYMDGSLKRKLHIQERDFLQTKGLAKKVTSLFLCRSSTWTPPWLDGAYFKLQDALEQEFGEPNYTFDPVPIMRNWNREELIKSSENERKAISEMFNKIPAMIEA